MSSPTPSPEPPSDSPQGSPGSEPADSPTRSDLDAIVSAKVRNAIAVVIVCVWAASFIADVLSTDYQAPAGIYVLMIALASAIFGSNFVKGMRP